MYSSALETDVGCMGLGLTPPSHPLAIGLMNVSRFAYSFIYCDREPLQRWGIIYLLQKVFQMKVNCIMNDLRVFFRLPNFICFLNGPKNDSKSILSAVLLNKTCSRYNLFLLISPK